MPKTNFFRPWWSPLVAIILSACTPVLNEQSPPERIIPVEALESSSLPYWTPSPSDTFQIQLINYPPDISIDAGVFELDLFETSQGTIDSLHNSGKKVICYLNAGAWEEYRPDAADFPNVVIGKKYVGWEGERWLDISEYKSFSSIISERFDLAVKKGCDGIDADNINGYLQNTGFPISAQDQIIYNIWLTNQAHQRDLAIGMKNNGGQVSDLEKYFDFAILEGCAFYDECEDFLLFSKNGKTVFQIEYTDELSSLEDFCGPSRENGYVGIFKNRSLDSWIRSCESE
jgi:endo-alpha-1,4-polygalactosaminidase (GH114 family)